MDTIAGNVIHLLHLAFISTSLWIQSKLNCTWIFSYFFFRLNILYGPNCGMRDVCDYFFLFKISWLLKQGNHIILSGFHNFYWKQKMKYMVYIKCESQDKGKINVILANNAVTLLHAWCVIGLSFLIFLSVINHYFPVWILSKARFIHKKLVLLLCSLWFRSGG